MLTFPERTVSENRKNINCMRFINTADMEMWLLHISGWKCINECVMLQKCGFRGSRKLSLFVIFPDTHLYTSEWLFQLIFPSLCEVTVVPGGKSGKLLFIKLSIKAL